MRINFDHLVGKPYKLGARGPDEYDCWGVVREISSAIGVSLPEYERTDFTRTELMRLIRGETHIADPIDAPVDGAVAWVASGHVGIYYDGCVYSAEKQLGVMAMPLGMWLKKYPTKWYKPNGTSSHS